MNTKKMKPKNMRIGRFLTLVIRGMEDLNEANNFVLGSNEENVYGNTWIRIRDHNSLVHVNRHKDDYLQPSTEIYIADFLENPPFPRWTKICFLDFIPRFT